MRHAAAYYKQWVRRVVFITAALVIGVSVTNYVVDPFDIFGTGLLKHDYQVNERFAKIDFLKKNHDRFDSYIFGSSRVGVTDPGMLDRYEPKSRFYNMTVSAASLSDDLVHLKYFLEHGYEVRNIYLQIDPDNLIEMDHVSENDNLLFRLHPDVVHGDPAKFYAQSLFALAPKSVWMKIMLNIMGKDNVIFDVKGTGMMTILRKRGFTQNDGRAVPDGGTSLNGARRIFTGKFTSSNLAILREFKRLCRVHKIHLIMFTAPLNHIVADRCVAKDYLEAMKGLSRIGGFWDFGVYNSVTLDNRYYFDSSHYRPEVSRLIAARIFGDRMIDVPADFGFFVTKRNIDAHSVELRRQFDRRDALTARRGADS
jgi:hypothetical protein